VPFKGTPIKDIQVLGFLEARNLKFDNIYILDVNEGILPNNNREDSILPFDVRINLGLPTYRDKDRLFDYYLRCALLGANKSVLFYVENDQKERSRFIERIIWEKQKKAKDIKRDFFIPLSYNFSLNPYRPKAVPKDDEIAGYLKTFVYSASSLDTYFECPLKFYYRYILLPAEEKNVYEELEDKDVGNIVHKILEGYFRDKSIDYECKKFNEIVDAVFRELFGDNLNGEGLVIKYQIKQRLSDFISQYKVITGSQSIEILGLEKNFETTVQIDGIGDIRLEGKVDRLERRDYEVFIVDYKTSSERRKYVTKWDKFEIDNRSDWKKAFKSIQMIFYMYLLEKDRECKLKPSNASILLVREKDIKKAEVRLFGETDKGYQKQVGLIIDAIISEIITAKEFTPADNLRICDRCKYKNMCWR
jgi:ATP-dependent helicase/DNAse subunit B